MNLRTEIADLREMVIDGKVSRAEYEARLDSLMSECKTSELSLESFRGPYAGDNADRNSEPAFLLNPRKSN